MREVIELLNLSNVVFQVVFNNAIMHIFQQTKTNLDNSAKEALEGSIDAFWDQGLYLS